MKELGPYRLHEELGRGGMGVVYRAEDTRSGAQVALKVLTERDALSLERFRREATLLQGLVHPHLVRVLDVRLAPPVPYLVCEFVEGETLAQRVNREGALPWRQAARLIGQLAAGLGEAHARGLVHRDVKPANVLLAPGQAKLADFGLVKDFSEESLTHTGATLGTPSYMAPEQATGDKHRLSPRTDVYGLTATLFFALTGRPPFKGPTAIATLTAVLGSPPPRPSRWAPEVPPALDALCAKGMAKDPGDRPASPLALRASLQSLERGSAADPRGRPTLALVAVLGALGLGALAALPWLESEPAAEPVSVSQRIEALIEEAEVVTRRGEDCEAARALLTQALELDPTHAAAYAHRAETWIAQGDRDRNLPDLLDRVYADCERALAADPACAHALAVRGYGLARDGNQELAAESFARALELDPEHPLVYAFRGAAAYDAGRKDDAVRDFDRALELDPSDPDLWSDRGYVAFRAGQDPLRSLEDLDRALELEPDHGRAHENQAEVLAVLGRVPEAIEAYDRALAVNPHSLPARFGRAKLLQQVGQLVAALDDLDACVVGRPDCAAFYQVRGQVLLSLDRNHDALADLEQATELDPGAANYHSDRGTVLRALGRHDAAEEAYRKALSLDPDDPVHTERLAGFFQGQGQPQRALQVVLEAFTRKPVHGKLFLVRARLLVKQGETQAALADFDTFVSRFPRYAPGLIDRGTLHLQLENLELAKEDFSRAIALDSSDHEPYALRGVASFKLGDAEGARADFSRSLELAPNQPGAEAMRERLRHLGAPR